MSPAPGPPRLATCSPALRPPSPRAPLRPGVGPGTQQACADLATYRYLLHHPRSRGSLHSEVALVPLPHLDPSTRTTKTSSWETPTNPVPSRPGNADPPRRPLPWPCHPRPALRASGSPPLRRRTCFYLRVGTTWCMEGEGCILGWRLLWQQRVKANLPGLPSARPGQRTPPPTSRTPLIWLQAGENSYQSLGFGGADGSSSSCHGPTRPRRGPVPQALLDTPCIVHPVPTHSPCPGSSTLLYS